MRNTMFFLFLFLPLFALSQVKSFSQLELKDKPYYKEFNHFFVDSLWRFSQTIAYDDPNKFDEELWFRLTIEVRDTTSLLKTKHLDFTAICQTAKSNYAVWSVWGRDQDSSDISGNVELASMTESGVVLKLNIVVTNLRTKNQFVYKGERLFRRTATIHGFYNH